ncbi:hypothetical protein QS306_00860 [Paraburkholderia bonniea]|uniref:hypothetical protein n=1 Tax=Paraburkholderia bonniea TaxID=2152891 RepID=UPI0012912FC7|nr:hypothetical protein [Paraburkholderia bonniea]WJF90272.1 hypothetical protein QS306_00860 [Paraburkholderia bonniea]WJF93587.1 hypothetical protein QS308_00860 [Paraburkholderia bonniea]
MNTYSADEIIDEAPARATQSSATADVAMMLRGAGVAIDALQQRSGTSFVTRRLLIRPLSRDQRRAPLLQDVDLNAVPMWRTPCLP